MKDKAFASEAELVAAFCADIASSRRGKAWVAYHETAGWDLLLAHPDGQQVGIEAKLTLNAKVLEQALPRYDDAEQGPDYRAVLVPQNGLQLHLSRIALHLGITIIVYRGGPGSPKASPPLPDEEFSWGMREWPNWCPARRCVLPDYVPDVTGGKASPVALTAWKVKAIKLLIVLERTGGVTRADMKALEISPSRWTDAYHGFLKPGPDGGYVANDRTPDLKGQHPRNWAEIDADFDTWSKNLPARLL